MRQNRHGRFGGLRSAFSAASAHRRRRNLRRPAGLGLSGWETLGHAATGLESLENRMLMAADLAITIDDNIAADVLRNYYQSGSQVNYTVKVTNVGDADATNAKLSTALAGAITQAYWIADYATGASGSLSYDDAGTPRAVPNVRAGAGNLDVTLTVAKGSSATFTIVATVGAAATGDLVSTATIDLDGNPLTTNDRKTVTDTDTFVPQSVVVSDDAGWTSTSIVQLMSPTDGSILASAYAFEAGLRTGVQAVAGDLDADGKLEFVCCSGYGHTGEVVVLRQDIGSDGSVTLVRDSAYDLQPFGPDYRHGLVTAVGNFVGDQRQEIAVAQAWGSGAVKIFAMDPAGPAKLVEVAAFTPSGVGSLNGVSLAAGDFGTFTGGVANASAGLDGICELVVASRAGAAPMVQVYDVSAAAALIDSFQPFTSSFLGGLAVTVARVDRNSTPDIIVSQGRGGSSNVEIYDGRLGQAANPLIARFNAFADLARSAAAVSAAAVDTDGDGRANVIEVAQGGAGDGGVRRYTVNTNEATGAVSLSRDNVALSAAGRLLIAAAAARENVSIITTDFGLRYRDLVVGSGATLAGKKVTVDYTGSSTPTPGSLVAKVFDSSKVQKGSGSPTPYQFTVGNGEVITGWDQGVAPMQVGGTRALFIPTRLAYSTGNLAGQTLAFEVKAISTP